MRIDLDLDEDLIKEVLQLAPGMTLEELVHLALKEFVENRRPLDMRDLRGAGGIRPDYDHKRLR